jgi:hypothetical protein
MSTTVVLTNNLLKVTTRQTKSDEFIVMEKDKDIAEQLMYSEWPQDLPVLAEVPWKRCCEPQSEGF